MVRLAWAERGPSVGAGRAALTGALAESNMEIEVAAGNGSNGTGGKRHGNGGNGGNGGGGRWRWPDGRDHTRVFLSPTQGRHIKRLLEDAGLSQQDIAIEFGYSPGNLSKALGEAKKRRSVPAWLLGDIAAKLGITLDALMEPPVSRVAPRRDQPRDQRPSALDKRSGPVGMLWAPPRWADQAGTVVLAREQFDPTLIESELYAHANAGLPAEGGGLCRDGVKVLAQKWALAKAQDARVVRVRGECMNDGANPVRDGDLIVVDAARRPQSGEAVCVRVKANGEVIFKRWWPLAGTGRVLLVPDVELTGIGTREEFAEDELEFIGTLVQVLPVLRAERPGPPRRLPLPLPPEPPPPPPPGAVEPPRTYVTE